MPLDELRALAADVRFMRDTLEEWQPVIHAYLGPTASGPLAWAARRAVAKQGGSGDRDT